MIKKIFILAYIALIVLSGGCKRYLEVEPPIKDITSETIYNSNALAASVLTGIYADWGGTVQLFSGEGSIGLKTGLSGDELVSLAPASSILMKLYKNTLSNDGNELFFSQLYHYIYKANSAIEGISKSSAISENVKKQLIGEAKFIRAYLYFNLVNLYGDVPLLLSTNLENSLTIGRTPTSTVYASIIRDLEDSVSLLSESYFAGDAATPTSEKVRPSKFVALAFLAKVYLYDGKWEDAESLCSQVINSGKFQLETHDKVFLNTSKEAIWQIQTIAPGVNTFDGPVYILYGDQNTPVGPNGNNRPVYLSKVLYDSFEVGDARKSNWIDVVSANGDSFPFVTKYKIWETSSVKTEYIMMLRLAEVYLIRAEARAMQGKLFGQDAAISDLNIIRNRSALGSISSGSRESVLDAIFEERRHELFTENGNRWFDLKRSGKVDQVMTSVALTKDSYWQSFMQQYPLPVEDIQNSPQLQGHQNPGYPER